MRCFSQGLIKIIIIKSLIRSKILKMEVYDKKFPWFISIGCR